MLVIYGVAEPKAILFVLVVHTIQTALVVLLGVFGWIRLNQRPKVQKPQRANFTPPTHETLTTSP